MSATWRFVGALAVATVVFYYGATSEVAWLLLLAYWIVALIVAAYFYARWNWRGLAADFGLAGTQPAPDSPLDTLPEQLLRSGPIPAPIFEGDRAEIELRLSTKGGARGPARLAGWIRAIEVRAATGVVPKSGWMESRTVGPVGRGPILAEAWVLESSDPLGFFRFWRKGADREVGLVLPRFISLTARPQARELEASVSAPRAGSGTELFGVREYRAGDPLRRIHWRSSARLGELVVREYEPPGVQTVGIFCDPNPPTSEVADQVARLAASEAWDCIRGGGRVVLWAPGLEPSLPSDARSLWPLLEWLARYPQPSSEPAADVPPVSDAVGVTAGASAPLIEALETVRQRGGRIRAWVVGDADFDPPPRLPGRRQPAVGGTELDLDCPVQRVGTSWPL